MKSPTKFILEIDLGNDAMQTRYEIANALETVAEKLRNGKEAGSIMDENGNKVGEFKAE